MVGDCDFDCLGWAFVQGDDFVIEMKSNLYFFFLYIIVILCVQIHFTNGARER